MKKGYNPDLGIMSKTFDTEYYDGDLVLKPWHFPVRCPDCEDVYTSLEGMEPLQNEPRVTQRCSICGEMRILHYEEPKPITQREVDGCGPILEDVPGADKLGIFGVLLEIFAYFIRLADPDEQIRFFIFCIIVISSPFWFNEILEWVDVLFFY